MVQEQPFHAVCADLLRRGIPVRFRVSGTSMRPVIREGDEVVARPLDGEWPRPGQVVVASGPWGFRVHRVVATAGGGNTQVVLRGDALAGCDAPVPGERILGRVAYVLRDGRRVGVDGPFVRLGVVFWRVARSFLHGFRGVHGIPRGRAAATGRMGPSAVAGNGIPGAAGAPGRWFGRQEVGS